MGRFYLIYKVQADIDYLWKVAYQNEMGSNNANR